MDIMRNYEDILETMTYAPVHPKEALLDRLVKKGIVTQEAASRFLSETK